jgi:hypothetical protein
MASAQGQIVCDICDRPVFWSLDGQKYCEVHSPIRPDCSVDGCGKSFQLTFRGRQVYWKHFWDLWEKSRMAVRD